MPIYEYNCQECKQIFEEWQKDYEEREIPCPVCGGNASRIISSSSFVLKGGGWYAGGYNAAQSDAAAPATATPDKPAASGACPGACAAAEKPAASTAAAPAAATTAGS